MNLAVEEFLARLSEAGLATKDEIQSWLDTIPENDRPNSGDELARTLVTRRLLTEFQSQSIFDSGEHPLVLGQYVLLDRIGQGGTGTVYKALHRHMRREVAIKVLHAELAESPDALRRFQREMLAGGKLNHPHVVPTLDAAQQGDTLFLVMEYVPGTNLATLVNTKGPLPVEQAAQVAVQAAKGLAHAHEQGVVHRDIKPSNLLRDSQGNVRILDLGLARFTSASDGHSELTGSGDMMGTVDYMAPEQAVSTKQADARSDIYSLGCTLFFLLTGRPPFGGETMMTRLLAHRDTAVPSLRSVRSDLPASLDEVVCKMLAKDPEERYQSMQEVVTALQPFEGWGGWRAIRSRWLTRRNAMLAGAAVLLVAAIPIASRFRWSEVDVAGRTTPGNIVAAPVPPTPTEILTSSEWEWSPPENLGPMVNTTASDGMPCVSPDGLTLVFVRNFGPIGSYDLWWSTRAAVDEPFAQPIAFDATVNSSDDEHTPFLSADGSTMLLASSRPNGLGKWDLWSSSRTTTAEPFGSVVNLGASVNSDADDRSPCLSMDGLTLLFASNRPGGPGEWNLWTATRKSTADPFVSPTPLGADVNVEAWTQNPLLSADGRTLLFASDRPGGFGVWDVWMSTRVSTDSTFEAPANLGPIVNTAGVDSRPAVARDGTWLIYESNRPGGEGDFDLWITRRIPKSPAPSPLVTRPTGSAPPMAIVPFDERQAASHQVEWARHLGVPVEIENSVGMKLRLIPPGEFTQGAGEQEVADAITAGQRPFEADGPPHLVRLTRPFFLGIYEVTQAEYETVVGRNPSQHSAGGTRVDAVAGLDTRRFPVEMVSWFDAVDFCNALSARENRRPCYERMDEAVARMVGDGYRLPTEAEWEFACRAGTETPWSCDGQLEAIERRAWLASNSGRRAQSVGLLRPNPFRLYDLQGNLWEWCQDYYDPGYYQTAAGQMLVDPTGPTEGLPRSMRGGVWNGTHLLCRSAHRGANGATTQNESIGLRVVLTIP
jgi:serine/threonine protein kinase/formylglycine-generating enzyme required for sulfatase activity